MKTGIVGFPSVGKTTLFNILTDARAETSRFGTSGRAEPNIGVARVPDPRLDALAALFKPRKTTPATVDYVDLVGVRRSEADSGLFLSELKNADDLLHVVRAFAADDLPHSEGSIDPARDIATMETTLMVADLTVAEKRLEKARGLAARGEEQKDIDLVSRVAAALAQETPVREIGWTEDEARQLRGYAFLSGKPILHLINLGEEAIARVDDFVGHFGLQAVAARRQSALAVISARIEREIADLAPEDAAAFQADLGIAEPCRPRVIRASYDLLGLISFFTAGEDECRAWSIPAGTPARRAAGAIHSDIEKGFIRAEVVRIEELLAARTFAAVRDRGQLRLEGKEYVVRDGDVVHFRFAV